MKRQIEGLHKADQSSAGLFPNTLFLVRTDRARYRWHAQRPYYALQFAVLFESLDPIAQIVVGQGLAPAVPVLPHSY